MSVNCQKKLSQDGFNLRKMESQFVGCLKMTIVCNAGG